MDFVCEEDKPAVAADLQELLKVGSAQNIYRLIRHDGTPVPYHYHGSVLKNENGEIYGTTSALHDITTFVKKEKELRLNAKFLKDAQRIARLGSYAYSFTDKLWSNSEVFDDILGIGGGLVRNPDELLQLVLLDQSDEAEVYFKTVLLDKRASFDKEFRVVRANDGQKIWVRWRGELVFDRQGNPEEMIGTIQDITEHKLFDEQLLLAKEKSESSSKHFRELAETIPVGIIESDLDGIIIYCNAYYRKLLEYEEDEILGKHISFNLPTPERLEFIKYLGHLVADQPGPRPVYSRVVRKSGSEVDVETFWDYRRNSEGRLIGFSSVIVDVTEQHEVEEGLRKAKELAEKATKIKDKFVSLVAHDLKSPLSTMIGFLKVIERSHGDKLDKDGELILSRAIASGSSLMRLIDDLLNMNRLKNGKLRLNKQFFDVKYLAAGICASLFKSAEKKGITLVSEVRENCRVYGDRTLIEEAVQNIVANSVKFCSSGDGVTITASSGDGRTIISVSDTGPGIRLSMLEKIFKYEEKTSTTGTDGEGGTGLGLPLAKDILAFHGGDLEIKNHADKGCTFSLYIPLVKPKIMIVDDDKFIRRRLKESLTTLDVDIMESGDGLSALNTIVGEKDKPHLVILDIELPGMSGLDVLARMRADSEAKSIPVIVISGEHGIEIKDTVFGLGAKDFLTKQFNLDDFIPRVRRFVA
jgi:PAS domain S-box-containing protein